MSRPDIYFYIPDSQWPQDLPSSGSWHWSGFGIGIYAWTVQTYRRLQEADFPCALVNSLPDEGIVFLHRNGFRHHARGIKVNPRRLLVCFQGDLAPHPDAQIHVVQNRQQHHPPSGSYFMPHWPQPGLQPRDPARGDRFETVSFFGHRANLAPEFHAAVWTEALEASGLHWQPTVSTNQWCDYQNLKVTWDDYRHVDAVVAVRTFNSATLARNRYYRHKPATKLYNAWLAGVPAILGQECGYRAERRGELDYLEVASLSEALEALTRLQRDGGLRQAMIKNGYERSQAITPKRITQQWISLIQDILIPIHQHGCASSFWQRQVRQQYSRLKYGTQRLGQRVQDWYHLRTQG